MLSVALFSLILPVAIPLSMPASPSGASGADPAVRISLDHRDYEPGDRVRATVQVRDDGYLLVLRLSADGYARVLFPLDPGNDNFVRGNGEYEIRDRGDRDAFTAEATSGTGTVYAAWSSEPFRFNDFTLGDHWDYRAIDGSLIQGEPEAVLTDLAQRMSAGYFDYDLVYYTVERPVAYSGSTEPVVTYPVAAYPVATYPVPVGCVGVYDPWCPGYYPGGSWFSLSVGFGRPFGVLSIGRYYPVQRYYPVGRYYPHYYDSFYYGNRGCYYCRYPSVVVINRPGPGYRYQYPSVYRWKPGSHGGGGRPGVVYRPRYVFASNDGRVASPLFVASKYRRVPDKARGGWASQRGPSAVQGRDAFRGDRFKGGEYKGGQFRGGEARGFVGRARRVQENGSSVNRDRVLTAPRRAESGRESGRRGGSMSIRSPERAVQRNGAVDSRGRSGSPAVQPRRAEPRATPRSGSASPQRAVPQRAVPRRAEQPSAAQRSASPRRSVTPNTGSRVQKPSAALRGQPRSEARSYDPPARAEQSRRSELRSAPRRVESQASPRRAEPQSAPQRVRSQSAASQVEVRSAPRRVESRSVPRLVEARTAPARQVERQAAPARRMEPRSAPRQVERQSAPARRAEPRSAPRQVEARSAPARRAEPRASAPRSSRQVSSPRGRSRPSR